MNVRDLGGLPVADGETLFGRFFVSAQIDTIGAEGWNALLNAGVRTVVDLRNLEELRAIALPPAVARQRLPVDPVDDPEFMRMWSRLMNSPIYYLDSLDRFPDTIASVFLSFAEAGSGGILFHCGGGRDRTGLITAMLLRLVGATDEVILDDYEASARDGASELFVHDGEADVPAAHEFDEWILETRAHLGDFLRSVDIARFLLDNGLTEPQLDSIRRRILPATGTATPES